MDPDFMLVLGVLFFAVSLWAIVEEYTHARSPRFSIILIVTGASLIVWANFRRPGGYDFGEVPALVVSVIASAFG